MKQETKATLKQHYNNIMLFFKDATIKITEEDKKLLRNCKSTTQMDNLKRHLLFNKYL